MDSKVLTWNDPRFAWNPSDYSEVSSMTLPFSKFWAPEVILHNAADEKFIYRQIGTVKSNGDIGYLVSIHAKSHCKPNYDMDDENANGHRFPFNIQTCSLKFGSWINEDYKVEYRVPLNDRMMNQSRAINLAEFSSPGGWRILATEANLESTHYPTFDEPSTLVVFTFAFRRDFFYDKSTGILWKVILIYNI